MDTTQLSDKEMAVYVRLFRKKDEVQKWYQEEYLVGLDINATSLERIMSRTPFTRMLQVWESYRKKMKQINLSLKGVRYLQKP